jgi:DNA-binding GntR family transcriptional regulator
MALAGRPECLRKGKTMSELANSELAVQLAPVDPVELEHERRVEEVARILEDAIRSSGGPIAEVVTRLHEQLDVSAALVREALVRLLYSGVVALTEDRRLIIA